MRDATNLAIRLSKANPVPGVPAVDAPADVLARIVSAPRPAAPRGGNALIRRPLLAGCIALLIACGIALAANISVRYFDKAGAKPLPDPVRRALQFAADHRSPSGPLAFGNTVTAYAFGSASGRGAVYMTPYVGVPGFCAALEVAGKPVQAGCISTRGSIANITGDGAQPWDLRLAPDIHAFLGRLAPSAAGDTVQIAFEDGTRDDVPKHGRWFAYAVAGEHARAGHRPVQLAILRDGRVIRRRALDPVAFNTLATARALVPAADGSRGQTAVRRYLLDNLSAQFADGGNLAAHTDIGATARVASLRFVDGVRIDFYAAPVRRLRGWPHGGAILLGLTDASARPVVSFVDVSSPPGATFQSVGGCGCVIPGHQHDAFALLREAVPRGVASVAVRTADGREHRASLYRGGREWIWVGRDTASARPVALIGRNAEGRVVTTRRLRGRNGLGG